MRRGCPPKMESRGDGCSNVSRGRLIRERRGLRCRGPGPGPEQQRPGAKRRGRPGPAQGPACVEINRCFGCTDNSSRSHFSAMAWPRWLRRAVRNRHGHAIEQASRRWRERRRGDSGRTRRKFDFHTGSSRPATVHAEGTSPKRAKTHLCGHQIYGAFVLNRRVDLHVIDATPAG